MELIKKNIKKINELCEKHNVSELYVFGSIVTSSFNKESDVDFLVDFVPMDVFNYADNYFDLKFALERIFNKEIDLLEKKALNNPYLKKSIDSSKKLIYGRRDKNLAV